MDLHERDRLYLAALDAYRKAQAAFENDPQPGTPEWGEWQLAMIAAEHMTAKYTAYMQGQGPARPTSTGPGLN